MKFIYSIFIVLILSFSFNGCQGTGIQAMIYGTSKEFNNLSLGMSKKEVIEVLGTPVSTSADADLGTETLIYKKMKHAISMWARTYQVVLRDGKVIKYGEQYEEKNINHF